MREQRLKVTDDGFGCFSSKVLADRADLLDFHISRMADNSSVLVINVQSYYVKS